MGVEVIRSDIEKTLAIEINEFILKSKIEDAIKVNNIEFGKYVDIFEEIEGFILDLEDNKYLETKESIDEKIKDYKELSKLLGEYPIYQRFKKEIRELTLLSDNKPTEKQYQYQILLKQAPICPKCNSICVPRLGEKIDCWQCEDGHWRKKMTSEQKNSLSKYYT